MQFSQTQNEQLQRFARQHRLTVSTLLQGAWASLLSCYSGEQIVSRANQTGLALTPKLMFEYQTIAELARVLEQKAEEAPVEAEQGAVTGELPLLPIQRWFFEQNFANPHHFNQAMMLTVREVIDSKLLHQTVQELFAHHDALRLRFYQEEGELKDSCEPTSITLQQLNWKARKNSPPCKSNYGRIARRVSCMSLKRPGRMIR